MKKTELRKLAKQIATAEHIIQTSQDKSEVAKAQENIIRLTSRIDIVDLDPLDEMIQEILAKNLN
jgi:Asp-tRNA(Asn)/Glu-tRNA(Gln) amidotransferase C subunit